MSESVCLQCGSEIQYDWMACPECGWKSPESWETPEEEVESIPRGVLSKRNKWIKTTTWVLLAAVFTGLVLFLFRFLQNR